jgi:hypothetical protein
MKNAILFVKKYDITREKILLSNYEYPQSYMYFLFYINKSPLWLENQYKIKGEKLGFTKIANYEFRKVFANDINSKNLIIIGSANEISNQTKNVVDELLFENNVKLRILKN